MKRQIQTISIAIALIFILSSCSGGSTTKPGEINTNIGTKGLELVFQPNNPPARVFQNTQFPVLIKIANFGAENVENGYLNLAFEKDYIRTLKLSSGSRATQASDAKGQPGIVTFSVDGRSQINPYGDVNVMEFLGTSGLLEQQSEEKKTSIAATMCYPYKTILSTTFCIDPDISGMRTEKKVCTVSNMDFKGGQGAPIAVTRIEPLMLADIDERSVVPQFLIFFENVGKGIPLHPGKISQACSSGQGQARDNELLNIATVRVYASGNELLNCKPDDRNPDPSTQDATIRFRDKKDYIRCIFNRKESRTSPAFTSPLRVEITYGYMDTETVSFSIFKPLGH